MSKEYKVKLTELMPVFSIKENTDKKPDDNILDDDSYTNDYDDRPYTQQSRPPTRKAAIKARRNWNEQQTSVRTCTDQSKIHAIPHHGWNYDDWLKYVEDEPYEHVQDIHSYPHAPVTNQHNDPSSILDELERELTRYRERVDLSSYTEEEHIDLNEDEVFLASKATSSYEPANENISDRWLSQVQDTRSSSIRFNVYNDGNSRPNSVEHFIPRNTFRYTSIQDEDMLYPSSSSLSRVPLSSTPLHPNRNHQDVDVVEVQFPSTPIRPMTQPNTSDLVQEEDVTLVRRQNRIDYALYNRTGVKKEMEREKK